MSTKATYWFLRIVVPIIAILYGALSMASASQIGGERGGFMLAASVVYLIGFLVFACLSYKTWTDPMS